MAFWKVCGFKDKPMYDLTPEFIAVGGFFVALVAWAGVAVVSGRTWPRYARFTLWFLIGTTAFWSLTSINGPRPEGWFKALIALAAVLVAIAAIGSGLEKVHHAENYGAIWKAMLLWTLGIGLLSIARHEFSPVQHPGQASRMAKSLHMGAKL
jgi:hypothetical protein